MKLIIAITHSDDAGGLIDALTERNYRTTRIHTAGGFLRESNATVLVGVEDERVDEVISLIQENCHTRTQLVNPLPPVMEPGEFYMPYPIEVEVGGAIVFVLDVERYERL
ncbi:MAG: cyclic-di-AMP receptor [Chloroflexi bacterium]|nr:cyclic-di-AMP receptor [Chloroflexota bacterium]MCL5075961.1 cyclic-di-AMP receptor [Chloroflexota bacterium]